MSVKKIIRTSVSKDRELNNEEEIKSNHSGSQSSPMETYDHVPQPEQSSVSLYSIKVK